MAYSNWKLNGSVIASPEYPIGEKYNNLDSNESTRLEDGTIYIKRIRTGIVTLDLNWKNLTFAQAKAILNVINNPSIVFFDCTYPSLEGANNPAQGSVTTKTFYAADTFWEQVGQDAFNLSTSFVEK